MACLAGAMSTVNLPNASWPLLALWSQTRRTIWRYSGQSPASALGSEKWNAPLAKWISTSPPPFLRKPTNACFDLSLRPLGSSQLQ